MSSNNLRALDAQVAERCLGWEWWAWQSIADLEWYAGIVEPPDKRSVELIRKLQNAKRVDSNHPRLVDWDNVFWHSSWGDTGLYLPYLSKNMGAAWQVAEWIREQAGPEFMLLWEDGRWECTVWVKVGDSIQARSGYADTPQEAICRLALKLVETDKKK